jgi:ABC-type uncharacterized transport system ATPase component
MLANKDKERRQDDNKPFELLGMKLNVPEGTFVAVVGSVVSAKSSLLQAMTGEMHSTAER